ncbi:MAG: transcription elongation factor Spt5 [Candidatus Helarchaeota archaeon]
MKETAKPQIFTIKTTISQEKAVVEFMQKSNIKKYIKAILLPETLRGYLFIETTMAHMVNQELLKIPHVRGKLVGKVDISELDKFLIAKKSTEGVDVGDIVEIIGGPFKGEKAKITRVDTVKDEVILELFESTHPIPIKVHADYIKKIMSREDAESDGMEGQKVEGKGEDMKKKKKTKFVL